MEELEKYKTVDIIPLEEMARWYDKFKEFSKSILRNGLDYAIIPGCSKNVLLKAGAEKLRLAYGLEIKIEQTEKCEIFEKNYLSYSYKCSVLSKGRVIAECEANANSYEIKYRYIWVESKVPSDEEKSILIAERKGKYVKNAYGQKVWHQRIENPDILNLKNTIMKISQKRAFVGAIIMACGASEYFTQDLDNLEIPEHLLNENKEFQYAKIEVNNGQTEAEAETVEQENDEEIINEMKKKETIDELKNYYKSLSPKLQKKFAKVATEIKYNLEKKEKESNKDGDVVFDELKFNKINSKKSLEVYYNSLREEDKKKYKDVFIDKIQTLTKK